MSAETRLKELNITLPAVPKPLAKYKPALQVGNILYVSGHGPAKLEPGSPVQGKVAST